MLRRLGIRSKVLAVLAVPMLVVLLAGVFISFGAVRDLQDARTARQVVDLVATSVPLNVALNDERVASLTAAPPEEIAAARQQTDAAIADFEAKASGMDLSRYTAALSPRLAEVLRQLSTDLPQIRANVDNAQLRAVGSAYATFVSTQIELVEAAAQGLTDRDLATYLAAYAAVARTADGLALEYVAGRDMLTRTEDSPAAGQSFATLASQTELLRATARTGVEDLQIASVALPTRDPSAAFTQIRNVLATGNVVQMSAVSVNTYRSAFTEQNDSFRAVSDGALTEAAAVAGRSITSAWQRTLVTVAVVALAAAASLVLALVVSRAIVIPLRRLTAAATDVREELPRLVEQVQVPGEGPQVALPQIPVTTRDEVGRLAAAFNAVNSTTVQVAQEQAALRGSIAEMFVNVARRDQVLLNRQLSFIDSLERTEEDPQALANLFRLDHLATRMRRNAESLLVLAGIDSGRRLRDALPLSDVVRTASSEIEQYDRVQLDLQADPHMLGFNALPAAHLLAELLENATVFSEPETPVVVTTAVAGPYVEVRIADEGLGMTEAELSAANEKIASTSAADALGAQRLGLYVVGRLAQRLSAEVILRKSRQSTTGTETVVRFPATLFQSTEASPLGAYGQFAAAGEAPVVAEVDLTALTDGTTAQGLPRRRTVDAPSGGLPLPTRLPARQRGNDEDGIVLPPVASPDSVPADLSSGAPDWSPVVQSGGSGLPSRTPAAADAAVAPAPEPTPVPDPAAHAGLFAGFFRGRGEAAAAQQTAADDDAPVPASAAGAPGLPFVVPGLMPEDDGDHATWDTPDPYETHTPAPAAWASGEPVADPEPAFAGPADEAAPAPLPTREPVAFGEAAPAWAADVPAWPVPDEAAWPMRDEPAWTVDAPVAASASAAAPGWPAWAATPSWDTAVADGAPAAHPASAPAPAAVGTQPPADQPVAAQDEATVVEPWTPATLQPWSAPTTDTGQWPVVGEPAPAGGDASDAFAGLTDWSAHNSLSTAGEVYAPFERTLDEARAWATGSTPAVPDEGAPAESDAAPEPVAVEPAAAPDDVPAAPGWTPWSDAALPDLAPDIPAWEVDAQAETTVFEPIADEVPGGAPAEGLVPTGSGVDEEPAIESARPSTPAAPAQAAAAVEPELDGPLPTPAWGPISTTPVGGLPDTVREVAAEPKRRRGLFGRRPKEPKQAKGATPVPAPAEPPVRSSAWAPAAVPPPMPAPPSIVTAPPLRPVPAAPEAAPEAPTAAAAPLPASPVAAGWAPQASWSPPAAATLPDGPVGASWSPPEWAPRPAATSAESEPVAGGAPTSQTHIGTLDDEVAAMLALRSDIQEQALSELSHLSAYRPQVVPGSERLTRRVPAAVPEAAPDPTADSAAAVERDPDELRSRLASFQSGTARGRRDADREPEETR